MHIILIELMNRNRGLYRNIHLHCQTKCISREKTSKLNMKNSLNIYNYIICTQHTLLLGCIVVSTVVDDYIWFCFVLFPAHEKSMRMLALKATCQFRGEFFLIRLDLLLVFHGIEFICNTVCISGDDVCGSLATNAKHSLNVDESEMINIHITHSDFMEYIFYGVVRVRTYLKIHNKYLINSHFITILFVPIFFCSHCKVNA